MAFDWRQRTPAPSGPEAPRGVTLLELLIVVALIAMGSAGAVLAWRDDHQSALDRDARRLAAVLDVARARSRNTGARIVWLAREGGYVLQETGRPETLIHWMDKGTRTRTTIPLTLGPEPIVAPQSIVIDSSESGGYSLWIGTDGLAPFAVRPMPLVP